MGGPDTEVPVLSPGTVLDERFRVEQLLGAGGMGAVYEITHLLTQHRRALKLLHPHYARRKTPVQRFFREASAAGRIGHENIAETFDAGWLSSGEPYLVMELLDGLSLADRLEDFEDRGMPIEEVVEVFAQLCDGVQAAHDAGIVHRDLKPENVFLVPAGDGWRAKVLDFGVSKFDEKLATKLTSGDSFVGTPAYMSPEQFERGADIDARSDVYSLGVILYEMVAGAHPFPATTMMQLARMIMLSDPPSLLERRPDAPRSLAALVARAMLRDPEERLASAREFALRVRGLGEDWSRELSRAATSAGSPTSGVSGVRELDRETMDAPMASLPTTVVMDPEDEAEEESPAAAEVIAETLPSAQETQPPPPVTAPTRWPWTLALVGVVAAVGFSMSRSDGPVGEGTPMRSSAFERPSPAPTVTPSTSAASVATALVPTATVTPSAASSLAPVETAPVETRPPVVVPRTPPPSPTTDRGGEDEWGPSESGRHGG